MKRTIIIFVAIFFAIGIVLKPAPSSAADVKVGVSMMGDWFQPGYMAGVNDSGGKLYGNNTKQNLDGSLMMGPMLWANIGSGWNLNFQMLFGVNKNAFDYSTIAADVTLIPLGAKLYAEVGESKIWKMDMDLGFEKELHKYVNLLIGLRFSYNDGTTDAYRVGFMGLGFPVDVMKDEFSNWYLGPEIGISPHFELYRNLNLSFGVSLLVQFGTYDSTKKIYLTLIPYDYKVGHFDIGLDNFLKISYYIEAAHLEVWVGGRYIFLPHIVAGDDGSVLDLSYKDGWITGGIEHFGGITFGAAYKF
jgi:hypothetical protein